jgi:hypothetical protein
VIRLLPVVVGFALACSLAPTAALAQPECDECCETLHACLDACETIWNNCMDECEEVWLECVNGCTPPGQPTPMWCRMKCQWVYNDCAGHCEHDKQNCDENCRIGVTGCLIVNGCPADYCDE